MRAQSSLSHCPPSATCSARLQGQGRWRGTGSKSGGCGLDGPPLDFLTRPVSCRFNHEILFDVLLDKNLQATLDIAYPRLWSGSLRA